MDVDEQGRMIVRNVTGKFEKKEPTHVRLGSDMPHKTYRAVVMHPSKVIDHEESESEVEEAKEKPEEKKKMTREERKEHTKKYGYAAKKKMAKETKYMQ